ncbi:FAD-binding oxidoreductase [Serratia ureilytica]
MEALKQNGFNGDTATSYADRLTMATDNSIYQLLPMRWCFPRSTADVALIARLAGEERFNALTFSPRGGTGTNGQSLNTGIVVDMSRHMNRILEINVEQGWVKVEAGVIKDQLNQYLRPFGYFFSPELSTSNRAALGGMINTDASGPKARWWPAKPPITCWACGRYCWAARMIPAPCRRRWRKRLLWTRPPKGVSTARC